MSPETSIPDAEKSRMAAEPAPSPDELDEYGDAEKKYQPRSPKFWAIIMGVYFSIFLVALVKFTAKSAAHS